VFSQNLIKGSVESSDAHKSRMMSPNTIYGKINYKHVSVIDYQQQASTHDAETGGDIP